MGSIRIAPGYWVSLIEKQDLDDSLKLEYLEKTSLSLVQGRGREKENLFSIPMHRIFL